MLGQSISTTEKVSPIAPKGSWYPSAPRITVWAGAMPPRSAFFSLFTPFQFLLLIQLHFLSPKGLGRRPQTHRAGPADLLPPRELHRPVCGRNSRPQLCAEGWGKLLSCSHCETLPARCGQGLPHIWGAGSPFALPPQVWP